jgi:hypothetical protein
MTHDEIIFLIVAGFQGLKLAIPVVALGFISIKLMQ